jgi:hypothetical protein
LIAGSCNVTLPAGYTVAPAIIGLTPVGLASSGSLRVATVTTTVATISSTDSADTRTFNGWAYGAPTGSAGVSTLISLYEKHPLWQIVTGTPAASPVAPATPTGYEAFAKIAVAANATTLTTGDITGLFHTITAL